MKDTQLRNGCEEIRNYLMARQSTQRRKENEKEKEKEMCKIEFAFIDIDFWVNIYRSKFVDNFDDTMDDLLFFVRAKKVDKEDPIFVARHTSNKGPIPGDKAVNWEETVYLNIVLHCFTYTVTVVVGRRPHKEGPLQYIYKTQKRVYPSPSRTRMETHKPPTNEITYPNLFFTIDDFEDCFKDVVCQEEDMVCVELVASSDGINTPIFQGSVPYTELAQSYQKKKRYHRHWDLPFLPVDDKPEFINMRGPRGMGYAQMAVSLLDHHLV
eukprot:Ihof_evm2s69 gene=Ihof_evmTU2s69